ncbi:MAG: PKD domain-containing protein [Bacteroidales bacterium]|nr:PKD domain-containing protein [Bacteroidales bacterium]
MKKGLTLFLAVLMLLGFSSQAQNVQRLASQRGAAKTNKATAVMQHHATPRPGLKSAPDGAIFYENFSTGVQGWSVADADTDGYTWQLCQYEEITDVFGDSMSIGSYSYNGSALTPDNRLFSPSIYISVEDAMLSWYDRTLDPNWPTEHYTVYIANLDDSTSQWVPLYDATLTADNGIWTQHIVSLANYYGANVQLMFRHWNSSDNFGMLIDEVSIFSGATSAPIVNFTYYPTIEVGSTITFYADVTSTLPATYEWQIDGVAVDTTAEFTHTWSTAGYYTVTLIATNANGSSSISAEVHVIDCSTPIAEYTYIRSFDSYTYLDCWQLDGWTIYDGYEYAIHSFETTDSAFIVSPLMFLPEREWCEVLFQVASTSGVTFSTYIVVNGVYHTLQSNFVSDTVNGNFTPFDYDITEYGGNLVQFVLQANGIANSLAAINFFNVSIAPLDNDNELRIDSVEVYSESGRNFAGEPIGFFVAGPDYIYGDSINYVWFIDGADTSVYEAYNAAAIWNTPGTYTVVVGADDGINNTAWYSFDITINEYDSTYNPNELRIDLFYTDGNMFVNEPVTFYASGSNSLYHDDVIFTWTFEDADTFYSYGYYATAIWSTPGEYDVTVTATNSYNTASYSSPVTITEPDTNYNPYELRIDNIYTYNQSGNTYSSVNDPVFFYLDGSESLYADDVTFTWSFEGAYAYADSGYYATALWNTPGTYTISVTATNSYMSVSASTIVYINEQDTTYIPGELRIYNIYTYNQAGSDYLTANDPVYFYLDGPESLYADDVTFTWSFEGAYAYADSGYYATALWNTPGTYTVSVTATNSSMSVSASTTVYINEQDTNYNPNELSIYNIYTYNQSGNTYSTVNDPVLFYLEGSNSLYADDVTFTWSFDGAYAHADSGFYAVALWDTPGTYTVSVTATNSSMSVSASTTVYINEQDTTYIPAELRIDDINVYGEPYVNGYVEFYVQGSDYMYSDNVSYTWACEDANYVETYGAHAIASWTTPGTYTVTVTASDGTSSTSYTTYVTIIERENNCPEVANIPYETTITSEGLQCWSYSGWNSYSFSDGSGYMMSYEDDAQLTSPWFQPADSGLFELNFYTGSTGDATYTVIFETADGDTTHIYTEAVNNNTFSQRRVLLPNVNSQNFRIKFKLDDIADGASWAMGATLSISELSEPIVSFNFPETVMANDNVPVYATVLSAVPVTYSWFVLTPAGDTIEYGTAARFSASWSTPGNYSIFLIVSSMFGDIVMQHDFTVVECNNVYVIADGETYSPSLTSIPECWSANGWTASSYDYLYYYSTEATDAVLTTQQITIPQNGLYVLNYNAATSTTFNYSAYVVTADGSETLLIEESLASWGSWYNHSFDLSQYAGQTIKIKFYSQMPASKYFYIGSFNITPATAPTFRTFEMDSTVYVNQYIYYSWWYYGGGLECTATWDLGGGQWADDSVNMFWTEPGTYTVTLTITNAIGSIDTSWTVTVLPASAPTITLFEMPAEVTVGETAYLSWSYKWGGLACETDWVIEGNGQWSDDGGIYWKRPGTYTVMMIVYNDLGADTATATITVTGEAIECDAVYQFPYYESLTSQPDCWLFNEGSWQFTDDFAACVDPVYSGLITRELVLPYQEMTLKFEAATVGEAAISVFVIDENTNYTGLGGYELDNSLNQYSFSLNDYAGQTVRIAMYPQVYDTTDIANNYVVLRNFGVEYADQQQVDDSNLVDDILVSSYPMLEPGQWISFHPLCNINLYDDGVTVDWMIEGADNSYTSNDYAEAIWNTPGTYTVTVIVTKYGVSDTASIQVTISEPCTVDELPVLETFDNTPTCWTLGNTTVVDGKAVINEGNNGYIVSPVFEFDNDAVYQVTFDYYSDYGMTNQNDLTISSLHRAYDSVYFYQSHTVTANQSHISVYLPKGVSRFAIEAYDGAQIDNIMVSKFRGSGSVDSLVVIIDTVYRTVDSVVYNITNIDSVVVNVINRDSVIYNVTTIDSVVYNVITRDSVVVNITTVDSLIYNIINRDTVVYNVIDSIIWHYVDSDYYDTIYIYDTLHVTVFDTVYDTIQVDITDVEEGDEARIYSTGKQIAVEGAQGRMVRLYDAVGRLLATKYDSIDRLLFDVPATGTYVVHIEGLPARKIVMMRQ